MREGLAVIPAIRVRLGLVLVTITSVGWAQGKPADDDTIDEVLVTGQYTREIVAAKSDVPLLETPQAISVQAADPSATPAGSDKESTLRKVVVTDTEVGAYTVAASESATPLTLSLRETPQSVTIMTRARLDDQKLESLRDVLDNTPGVY